MASPADRRYSESHEWFRPEGASVVVGLTKHAADQLTDITFAEVKPVGTKVSAGESVGEVESVKTASEIYSAIPGEVAEINDAVRKDPSLINSDPFGKGWLCKIRSSDPTATQKLLASLMDAAAYDGKNSH
ncbi:MAG: glycine cleavage system protein GcvH [Phycisphaerae bacterium]|nr:glycine cleavage system protein GcvH [Phycisphaerae bacterium]